MYIISYSGGIQSTALLALAAQQRATSAMAVFVDLKEAEDPRTRRYVDDVAIPYCEEAGIRFIRVEVDALGDMLANPAHPKPPFRTKGGGFSVRQCTNHWKIRPFRRALRSLMRECGARIGRTSVSVALGISYDEIERMTQPDVSYYAHVFPLIERRMTRFDCARLLVENGLPVPPKSACWFCPYTRAERLDEITRLYPDVARALDDLRERVNSARARKGLPELAIGQGSAGSPCGGYCMA